MEDKTLQNRNLCMAERNVKRKEEVVLPRARLQKEMKVYLFSASNETAEKLAMQFAYSRVSERLITVGKPYTLVEGDRIELFDNEKCVMWTSSIISCENFCGDPKDAPVKAQTQYGLVSAPTMLVYTTGSGSKYTFIPDNVVPVLV